MTIQILQLMVHYNHRTCFDSYTCLWWRYSSITKHDRDYAWGFSICDLTVYVRYAYRLTSQLSHCQTCGWSTHMPR